MNVQKERLGKGNYECTDLLPGYCSALCWTILLIFVVILEEAKCSRLIMPAAVVSHTLRIFLKAGGIYRMEYSEYSVEFDLVEYIV